MFKLNTVFSLRPTQSEYRFVLLYAALYSGYVFHNNICESTAHFVFLEFYTRNTNTLGTLLNCIILHSNLTTWQLYGSQSPPETHARTKQRLQRSFYFTMSKEFMFAFNEFPLMKCLGFAFCVDTGVPFIGNLNGLENINLIKMLFMIFKCKFYTCSLLCVYVMGFFE